MVSVLVGVVAAASVHLFWLPPSNDDTTLARSEEPDPELEHGARPGGGETRAAPPSTSGGKTVSTTSTHRRWMVARPSTIHLRWEDGVDDVHPEPDHAGTRTGSLGGADPIRCRFA